MTLIIGFVCKDGVCLVSDTRVTNLQTQEFEYESKVMIPLQDTPFVVGAAGYAHLFREFNRKIPDVVATRSNEIRLRNLRSLIDSGLSRDEAIAQLYPKSEPEQETQEISQSSRTESVKHLETSTETIPLPYSYNSNFFIDDCKALIRSISDQVEDDPQAIEVLIALQRNSDEHPSLHFIQADGTEQEIDTFYPIGSGSPHVRLFFNRLYDYNKSIEELATLAFRAIIYSQEIALERSIGYTSTMPIESYAVLVNGATGRIRFKNELQVITNVENEMKGQFDVLIKNSRVNPLEWAND